MNFDFDNKGYFGANRLTSVGPLVSKQIIDENCFLTQQGKKELKSLRQTLVVNNPNHNITGEFIQEAQELGLVIAGEGSSRVVLYQLDEDCVIKISKLDRASSNKEEVFSYDRIKDEPVAQFFNPVIDWTNDFGIVTQRKADSIGGSKDRILDVHRQIIMQHGYYVFDAGVKENFGKFEDNVLVIDYAAGVEKVKNTEFKSRKEAYGVIRKYINRNMEDIA